MFFLSPLGWALKCQAHKKVKCLALLFPLFMLWTAAARADVAFDQSANNALASAGTSISVTYSAKANTLILLSVSYRSGTALGANPIAGGPGGWALVISTGSGTTIRTEVWRATTAV